MNVKLIFAKLIRKCTVKIHNFSQPRIQAFLPALGEFLLPWVRPMFLVFISRMEGLPHHLTTITDYFMNLKVCTELRMPIPMPMPELSIT